MPTRHKIWLAFWVTALVVAIVWVADERSKRPLPDWEDERPWRVPL